MADKKSLVNIDFGGSSSIKGLPSASPAASDCLVITDYSDGGKAKKGPSFATNDGKFLRHDGSWAVPGGKYRHNCTFEWNTGSGSNYYCGSLSFFFDDDSPQSYSDGDFGVADILNFIKAHCNMSDTARSFLMVTGGGVVGVEVATPYRTNETWIVTCIKNEYGDWYCNAVHYSKTNNFGNFKLEYYQGAYITFIPSGGVSVLYDRVTPL